MRSTTHPDTLADVLGRHGLLADEATVAAAVDTALAEQLSPPGVVALSPDQHQVLRAGGLDFDSSEGAYQRAAQRAVADYAALFVSALPVAEVAGAMGVSRARVQQLVSDHAVWAIRDDLDRWRLPRQQFGADGRPLPGFAEVARALPQHAHPLEVLGFLTTPQPELRLRGDELTPLQWLAAGGDPAQAAALAGVLRGELR